MMFWIGSDSTIKKYVFIYFVTKYIFEKYILYIPISILYIIDIFIIIILYYVRTINYFVF